MCYFERMRASVCIAIERPIQFIFAAACTRSPAPRPPAPCCNTCVKTCARPAAGRLRRGDCGACTVVLGELDADGGCACARSTPVFSFYRRWTAGAVHRGRPGRRRRPAPAATGADRPPRRAVRLLHAGLCHVAVCPLPQPARLPQPRRAGRPCQAICAHFTGYQPILDAAQAAWQATRRSGTARRWWPPCASWQRCRLCTIAPLTAASSARAAWPKLAALRQQHPPRGWWPVAPTWAVGDQARPCAGQFDSAGRGDRAETDCRVDGPAGNRRRRAATRRLCRAQPVDAALGRAGAPLPPPGQNTPARWAAISPMARRLATTCRR